mmetsp:Transcript_31076/g.81393  ORF Transcript_31076/g.81393 Transcript_31076/m.81393 type:complete len:242 (+) Transcript_31076:50-775(+)
MEMAASFAQTFADLETVPIAAVYAVVSLAAPVVLRDVTPKLSLRPVMIGYNAIMAAVNLYIAVEMGKGLLDDGRPFATVMGGPRIVWPCTVYATAKLFELLDTLFMILRHSWKQVTVLHVFHHTSMLVLGDFVRQRAAWPAIAVVFGMNAAVHVPLYTYYGLSAVGPDWQPARRWKVRLTTVQMIQFVVGMVHGLVGWLYHNFCIYAFLYGGLMLAMFGDFFVKTYIHPSRKAAAADGKTE